VAQSAEGFERAGDMLVGMRGRHLNAQPRGPFGNDGKAEANHEDAELQQAIREGNGPNFFLNTTQNFIGFG
jgi:hypothetical protein